VDGAGSGDVAIATVNGPSFCMAVTRAAVMPSDEVKVTLENTCPNGQSTSNLKIAIIVFDTSG
jgi:hypothetical protein